MKTDKAMFTIITFFVFVDIKYLNIRNMNQMLASISALNVFSEQGF